jgi:hypothetical protein
MMEEIKPDDLKLRHPFNMIVSGGSGSGKTEWVMHFLKNKNMVIDKEMACIFYCYGIFDDSVLEFERMGVVTHQGIPSEENLKALPKPALVILDDLMIEAKNEFLNILFTRVSHHMNLSLIFITQDIFTKAIKTARNNAHYIVLMRNRAGELQVRNLGMQLFPRNLQYFMEAYKYATEANYSYLFIDLHSSSNANLKLRTNIFPYEKPYILFLPR